MSFLPSTTIELTSIPHNKRKLVEKPSLPRIVLFTSIPFSQFKEMMHFCMALKWFEQWNVRLTTIVVIVVVVIQSRKCLRRQRLIFSFIFIFLLLYCVYCILHTYYIIPLEKRTRTAYHIMTIIKITGFESKLKHTAS